MTQVPMPLKPVVRHMQVWVVLTALLVSTLCVAAYLAWARAGFADLLDKRVIRETLALEQKTLSGQAMGAVKLAGRLNREIKEAAQLPAERARETSVAASALRTLASEAEAEQAFVINRQGVVTAEWTGSALTAVGLDVSFRHYFARALEGQASVSLAVSISTGDRRLFIAAPVYADRDERQQDDVIGVLLLQQSVGRIDAFLGQWRQLTGLLVSPDGVVMASSRPEWVMHHLGELGPDKLRRLQSDRLYGDHFKTNPASNTLPDFTQSGLHALDGTALLAVSAPVNFNHRLGQWQLVYVGDQSAFVSSQLLAAIGLSTGLLTYAMGRLLVRRRADALLRAQQRRELAASQARVETMIRNVPGVVYRSAAHAPWPMAYLSPAVEALTGYPAADFLGDAPTRTVASLMSPEDAARVVAEVQMALARREPYANEYRITHRNGKTRWVYSKGLAQYSEDGSPLYLDGMMFDITERKLAEAAVQQSENRLRELLDLTPVGCSINTLEGKSVFRNHRLSELLGLTVEELGNVNTTDYWADPADRAVFLAELQAEGRVSGYRAHFKRTDGTRFAVLLSSSFEHIFGAEHIVSWSYDISALEETELALMEARDVAEAATRAKSDFLANMSHEIRTPMNAIIGMSHLALQGPLERKQRNYIEKVHRAGENLLGIINDILDFSKIEAGKLSMESTDFRLEDVLDHFANLVSLKAEEKHIDLLLRIHPDTPTALIGDPLRLGQVLVNLGNNAVKFTERGQVVVGIETVAQGSEGVELHFWVQDSGIGMTPEQLNRLFQSFNQADSSTTRKYGGTGLGLAICKNLVQLMQGRIWAESEPGKGSTFHFHACFGVQDHAASPRMPDRQALQGVHALVVDDNSHARDILVDMLVAFGMDADAADGGHEALRMTELADRRGRPYALVLMDWQMPDLDGIAALEAMRDMALTQQPAALLVTSFNREQASQAAAQRNLGLSGVLTRPVTLSNLLEAVGHALHKNLAVETRKTQRADQAQQTRQQLRGARVLLVEDNDMNQELALELLGQAGMDVVLAINGQEALDKLATEPPFDGVLMDCQMPVMDGYTATRALRQNPQWTDLPVLAMTANAMAGDREKVLAAGMNDHIAKPLNVADMFATMAKWIKPARPGPVPGEAQVTSVSVAENSYDSSDKAGFDIDFLTSIGLDTTAGLAVATQDVRLYRRLLRRFAAGQTDFENQFRAAQSGPDATAPTRLAHTLKGAAGNIGARAVQTAAAALEAACHDPEATGAAIESQLSQTLEVLVPLVAALSQLAHTPAAIQADQAIHTSGSADGLAWAPSDLQSEQFNRLLALLADSDGDAGDVLDELLISCHQTPWEPALQQAGKALGNYDFDDALHQLQALKA